MAARSPCILRHPRFELLSAKRIYRKTCEVGDTCHFVEADPNGVFRIQGSLFNQRTLKGVIEPTALCVISPSLANGEEDEYGFQNIALARAYMVSF